MQKIYIVRLTDEERETCLAVVKKLKGTSQKVRRANILLKTDADGPNWKDQQIADTFFCTRQCVENLRKRLVTEGFEIALHGKKRTTPSILKKLDGEQEAKIIALRLSDPPKHGSWLNIAENELSALTAQCVKGRRFTTIEELRDEVTAWAMDCNAKQKGVAWHFTTDDARIKLQSPYPKFRFIREERPLFCGERVF